MLRCLR